MNTRVLPGAMAAVMVLCFPFVGSADIPVPPGVARFSHPVTASRDDVSIERRATHTFPDTIRLLAAMVQFQADDDDRTTGDGRFVLTAATDSVLDAPPRDRSYFEQHLTFLTNYYRKVSKGKVIILPTVIDSVFTLGNKMARYSPQDGGIREVVDLARDTWRLVDSSGLVPVFSAYECFVVFHAGVGRDIDLVSVLGYDPTPLDIPSLYIGINAFRESYGPTYGGVPVSGGFSITNSLVLPETESRMLPGVTGDVLLELTINGLLCASFGNYLGLPDLFDTGTGLSGIGRFGLMDGQAIFSFAGVFPPEPCAWEKAWLGWLSPIETPAAATTYLLPAVALADSVLRVPISGPEYYLVENRNRDPEKNGQRVVSVFNGTVRDQYFERDTSGFNAFDVSALAGVITDVQDPDWSLPGGVDDDGVFYDGGVLVWHIDEAVIQQRLESNSVNNDPLRRGVDVEEADGSQDIGQAYEQFTAGSGSEEGTALDFWYDGNIAPVYRNEFGPLTFPDTRSNTAAQTHISVRDFSGRGPRMNLTVDRSGGVIRPLPGFPKSTGEQMGQPAIVAADLGGSSAGELILVSTGRPAGRATPGGYVSPADTGTAKVYIWDSETGEPLPGLQRSGVTVVSAPQSGLAPFPAVRDLSGDGRPDLVVTEDTGGPNRLHAYSTSTPGPDSLASPLFSAGDGSSGYGEPVVGDSLIAVPARPDRVLFFRPDGSIVDSLSLGIVPGPGTDVAVCGWSLPDAFVLTGSDGSVLITHRAMRGPVPPPDRRIALGTQIHGRPVAGSFRRGGSTFDGVVVAGGERGSLLYLLDSELSVVPGFPVEAGAMCDWIALGDVDGDGGRDIVVFAGAFVRAYSAAGVSIDNFPVELPGEQIVTPPVIADISGDGRPEILGATQSGIVFAFGSDGRQAPGFPLQAAALPRGIAVFDAGVAGPSGVPIGLAVVSDDLGTVTGWVTASAPLSATSASRPWPLARHDARNRGAAFETIQGRSLATGFFPPSRAYNWPNPVYNGTTYLRYYLGESATVTITVYDFAGDKVTEFTGPGIGGMDNEVVWDVSGVQSGVYYARIEARGASETGVTIVTVAVVK